MAIAAHYLEILDREGQRVDGESEGHGYVGEIDITGWDWEVTDQAAKESTSKDKASSGAAAVASKGSAGSGDTGGIDPSLFTFTKAVDRSTIRLMQAMFNGEVFNEATFTLREDLDLGVADSNRRGAFMLHVVLKKAYVVSYRLGGRSSEHRVDLDETWVLNYASISFDYEHPEGGMSPSFDRKAGSTTQGASKAALDDKEVRKQLADLQAAAAKAKRG
jgi:type VI protein secretion system component Hcp